MDALKTFLLQKLLTRAFLTTILRNALIAVGGWLVGTGKLDAGQWETISGAIVVVVLSLAGGTDSVKDKVVQDGKVVAMEKLPQTTQATIANAVEAKKSRSVLDILFGK